MSDGKRLTVRQFLEHVGAAEIFSAEAFAELRANWSDAKLQDDAESLARELVKSGRLTQYQAAALYQGKPGSLVVGPYLVLDRLGSGGVGTVYKLRHRETGDVVAVKVLNSKAARSTDGVTRFRREAEMVLRLQHPNIVRALDVGDAGGRPYLAMELIDGTDLSSYLKQRGPMPFQKAVLCIVQTAQALAYAHGEGVIHRDIKPANILLTNDGRIKLLDMGLARFDDPASTGTAQAEEGLTQTGQVLGTVDYMAPEQALHTRLADARADVYGLGCTFFRLVAGKNPYGGESVVEKILAHREHPIPSLRAVNRSVPPATDLVLQRMLAKHPDDRYQTMAELADDLQRSLLPAPPPVVGAMTTTPAQAAYVAAPAVGNDVEWAGYSISVPPDNRRLRVAGYAAALLGAAAVAALAWVYGRGTPTTENATAENMAENRVDVGFPPARPIATLDVEAARPPASPEAGKPPVAANLQIVHAPGSVPAPTPTSLITTAAPPAAVPSATSVSPLPSPTATPMPTAPATAPTNVVAPARGKPVSVAAPIASAAVIVPPPPAVPDVAVDRRAEVPNAAELEPALNLIRNELFKSDYAQAKQPAARAALGRMLHEKAAALGDDPVGRFGLLCEARDFALEAGDLSQANKTTALAAGLYKVDGLDWFVAGLGEIQKRLLTAAANKTVVTAMLQKVDEATEQDRWEAAGRLMDFAMAAARKALDPTMLKAVVDRNRQFDKEKQQWDVVSKARQTLASKPDDPIANLSVGRHLCFIEGDWTAGFVHLARGSEPNLKEVAEKSLAAPTNIDEVIALGDLWWNRSERTPASPLRFELQAGAAYWYQRVAPQLTGLLKSKIDKRIADAAPSGTTESRSRRVNDRASYLRLPLSASTAMVMRLIPAGRFTMGSPPSETGRKPEETPHTVVLSKPFFLGVTEFTQEQWRAVMGTRERAYSDDPQFPAHSLFRRSIDQFFQTMNSGPHAGYLRFRLPTEAEWEYTARAGTTTAYYWGDDASALAQYAVLGGNMSRVATLKPNAWGLYDMAGNVGECCLDVYSASAYTPNAVVDPFVAGVVSQSSSIQHVRRGGAYMFPPDQCRSAGRQSQSSSGTGPVTGFRVACDVIGQVPPAFLTSVAAVTANGSPAASSTTSPPKPVTSTVPVAVVAAGPTLESTLEVNRSLANWALGRGGYISARVDKAVRSIRKLEEQPAEPFVVTAVNFSGSGNPLTDAEFEFISRHPWIIAVTLSQMPVSDANVAALVRIGSLEQLTIRDAQQFGDTGLMGLARAPRLKIVHIANGAITGSGLSALSALPLLGQLTLDGNPIGDGNLAGLSSLEHLGYLNLRRTNLTDAGMSQIVKLADLEILDVTDTAVTDAGLAPLASLKKLHTLDLGNCAISATGIAALKSCEQLSSLNLEGTRIDLHAVDRLAKLPKLEFLILNRTKIGDESISALCLLRGLQSLGLFDTQMTKAGIALLKERLPKCSVDN